MSRKPKADVLTADRRELAEALRSLKPIVKGTANHPVLHCALLRSGSRPDAPHLTISATNRENTLSLTIAREGGADDFSALVDLGRLEGFASADWGETLSLGLEKGRLVVEGLTVARIVVNNLDNFPELPQPPRGDGIELPATVIEEVGFARAFVDTDAKTRSGWQKVVHVFACEGAIDVFAGSDHRAWWRRGIATDAPEGFAVGLTPETAALLVAQAGKAGVTVRSGERQDFFSGPGYELAQTRPENAAAAPLSLLSSEQMQPSEWATLPQLANVLPVAEAVAQEAGERSPLLFSEDGDGETLVSVKSDLVDAEGTIAGAFPTYKTGYPADLLALLRQLDRVAGTERGIEVGRFGPAHLRFRVAGVAEGFISGMA